jgi:hypothetical protein
MKARVIAIIAGACLIAASGSLAQGFRYDGPGFSFRFGDDDRRGESSEGKRASCAVYAEIAVVQARANQHYRCGYNGPRWGDNPEPHFRWCRFVRRETLAGELRERAIDLQRCFDRLGDFDDPQWDRR